MIKFKYIAKRSHVGLPALPSWLAWQAGIWGLGFGILFFLSTLSYANNLVINATTLENQSTLNDTYDIKFNIAWSNSWRDAGAPAINAYWDAAWVFAKYTTWDAVSHTWSDWRHCKLKNTGYTVPSGASMEFGATGATYVGAFVYRDSAGNGNVSWSNAVVKWDYGADSVADGTVVKVKMFGIEMVYIPQGSFYVGSGGTETAAFYASPTTKNPYLITHEAAITVGTTAGNLRYTSGANYGDMAGPIPDAFPKGYNAFYMMKYEVTQGQYSGFLNMLTATQATARYYVGSANRYTISGSYRAYRATRPDRACNYLSWADVAAYGDWAGLRPFTELEFEKACRGPASPVANEYAWGNTTVVAAVEISGAENGTETINTGGANCCYNNRTFTGAGSDLGQGPLRVGIFARSGTTRAQAGAGYYGNMELSGSVLERPITVGNGTGRAFTGLHGDGALDTTTGNANVTNWPNTTATGVGFRGGNWYNDNTLLRVSDRADAAYTYVNRYFHFGSRLSRTAP